MRLEALKNTHRPFKKCKLLGRGPGSKRGKTSGRGQKGMGARSGYKVRAGTEGGGVPTHRRLPTRGFSNKRFQKRLDVINLQQVELLYQEGETLSLETLREKRYIRGSSHGVKLLGKGKLTKKIEVKVEAISAGAKKQLKSLGISVNT